MLVTRLRIKIISIINNKQTIWKTHSYIILELTLQNLFYCMNIYYLDDRLGYGGNTYDSIALTNSKFKIRMHIPTN